MTLSDCLLAYSIQYYDCIEDGKLMILTAKSVSKLGNCSVEKKYTCIDNNSFDLISSVSTDKIDGFSLSVPPALAC